jgi:protein-L-isoaspartate(D-aspartate) O-methyltransferase
VLERIRSVPRHLFVDEALASRAYEDSALPIGLGQTISQPWVVALMTQALVTGIDLPLKKVLEVGTGCGYQTAVLSPFVRQIYTIDRIGSLQQAARARLNELGFDNVRYRQGDGFKGWPGQAPFDGIIVAAAPGEVPPALLDQLSEGGRLIIPVGPAGEQDLVRITRTADGLVREQLSRVSFVPLVEGTG